MNHDWKDKIIEDILSKSKNNMCYPQAIYSGSCETGKSSLIKILRKNDLNIESNIDNKNRYGK